MSSKASLRSIERLRAGGKLREIKQTVQSEISMVQHHPDQFVELQFGKLVKIAVKLNQLDTLKRLCADHENQIQKAQSELSQPKA